MLDHQAPVHDTGNAGRFALRPRCLMRDAHLKPDELGADRDRLIDDRPDELASPEHIHDVNLVLSRRRREPRIRALAQQGRVPRIHGHDAIPPTLEIQRHTVTGTGGFRRQPHDGNRARAGQQRAKRCVVRARRSTRSRYWDPPARERRAARHHSADGLRAGPRHRRQAPRRWRGVSRPRIPGGLHESACHRGA